VPVEEEHMEDLVVGAVTLGALLRRTSHLAAAPPAGLPNLAGAAGQGTALGTSAKLSLHGHTHAQTAPPMNIPDAHAFPVQLLPAAGQALPKAMPSFPAAATTAETTPPPPSALINPTLPSRKVASHLQQHPGSSSGGQVPRLQADTSSVEGSPPGDYDSSTLTGSVEDSSSGGASICSGSTPTSPAFPAPSQPFQQAEPGAFGTAEARVGRLYEGDSPMASALSCPFKIRPSLSYVLPVPAAVRDSFHGLRDEMGTSRRVKAKQQEVSTQNRAP
jgi:hypothetical protein